ncbi:hypothetical protein BJ741DRAFT_597957 [Chytriomyces cf. hyalinus JEL632]|nr:hypothetical protein BJ741DRAFT_604250 [Chytriomyces cf. hyalinus JEL632]KAI8840100.1 hypothetical protein BJ741DRAFT_597957 [Chytriomyces cf. hyalinus JEL632]
MPLTKEQSARVRHEVDHAGLKNLVSCNDRITALSAEFQCDVKTVKISISNYQQLKKRKAANDGVVPAVGLEPTHDQQLEKSPSIPDLCELHDILVQKPRKVRLVTSEKMPGYQMFLRTLGEQLKGKTAVLYLATAVTTQIQVVCLAANGRH